MFNLIYNIPENAGWFIVGALAMLCAVMLVKVIKFSIEMCKEWITEEGE
jgi:hypothetical protein